MYVYVRQADLGYGACEFKRRQACIIGAALGGHMQSHQPPLPARTPRRVFTANARMQENEDMGIIWGTSEGTATSIFKSRDEQTRAQAELESGLEADDHRLLGL